MSDEEKKPPRTADEIQEERAKRRKDLEKAEEAQNATDLEALNTLEIEHGDGMVRAVKVPTFMRGLPRRVFFKAPTTPQYQRYTDTYGRATTKQSPAGQRAALELLGKSCWLYPTNQEQREALVEAFPGLEVSVGLAAAKLGEAEQENEGKD